MGSAVPTLPQESVSPNVNMTTVSGAEPSDVHAILYSDSTIGGTRAIAQFRAREIQRRIGALPPARRRSARDEVTREVDALFLPVVRKLVVAFEEGFKHLTGCILGPKWVFLPLS